MQMHANSAVASSSQERAYTYIHSKILSADYKPTQKLKAKEIASELEVSRTPVREALSRLAQEGLVESQGGWGYVVKPITVSAMLQLFRVREVLEVECIAEALPNLNKQAVRRLKGYLVAAQGFAQQSNWQRFIAENRNFHHAIARATMNPFLQTVLSTLEARVAAIAAILLHQSAATAHAVMQENERIVSAIATGNKAKAVAAVRAHLMQACQRAVDHLSRTDPTERW